MKSAAARRQQRFRASAAALVLLVLSTASCSNPNAMQDAPTTRPAGPLTTAQCPADGAQMGLGVAARTPPAKAGSIPSGFQPARVMVCQASDVENRGGHKIRYTMSTKEAPITPDLLTALQLPDESFKDDDRGVCTLEFTALPYLLLLNRQRQAVRAAIPVDACSKIRAEAQQAIAALTLKETHRLMVDDVYRGR